MELLIIACLILLNGILAMSELAVVSSKKIRLEAEIAALQARVKPDGNE